MNQIETQQINLSAAPGALWQYVESVRSSIEAALENHLPLAPAFIETDFNAALRYAMFPGGKRLRPVLTLLGAEIVGGARDKTLAAAAAVEFVHTSSLIFDDLPCMDDAPERRGKTALHQKFGEATAVLTGLALLNNSYQLIFAGVDLKCPDCVAGAIRAHAALVAGIGAGGIIGGQSIDLEIAKNKTDCNPNQFETRRNLKTSALIRMAIEVGAVLSGASDAQLKSLTKFANLVGDAYQTSDDLLDLSEDLHISNTTERRQSFALEHGAEKAAQRVAALVTEAKSVLFEEFGATEPTKLLGAMADYIAARKV